MTTLTQARAALLQLQQITPSQPPFTAYFIALTDYLDHQVAAQIEATARMLRAEGFVRECESAFKRLQHARLLDALPSQQARQDLAAALHEQVNLFGVGERVNTFPSSSAIADGIIDKERVALAQQLKDYQFLPVKVYTETDSTRPPSIHNFGKFPSHASFCMCTVCRPPL